MILRELKSGHFHACFVRIEQQAVFVFHAKDISHRVRNFQRSRGGAGVPLSLPSTVTGRVLLISQLTNTVTLAQQLE